MLAPMSAPSGETGPAGWYPEPGRPGAQRYWDGDEWTEHRAPLGGAKPAAEEMRLTSRWGLWTAIAGAVLVAIGSSGDWVVAGGESVSGLSRDGAITAVAAIAAILILALAHTKRWALITSGVLGGLCLLIGIVDVGDVTGTEEVFGPDLEVGWGLWLTTIAGGVIVIGAIGLNACLEPAGAEVAPSLPTTPPKPLPPMPPQPPATERPKPPPLPPS
jgi:hypothetical protein